MNRVNTSREAVERLATLYNGVGLRAAQNCAATLRALLDERDAAAQEARTLAMECDRLRAEVTSSQSDAAAARRVVRELRQRLLRQDALLREVPAALSASFNAGCEEREGGSIRRQARHAERVEKLRAAIHDLQMEDKP